MNEQLYLTEVAQSGRVRHSDPVTSVAAARTISGRTDLAIAAAFCADLGSGMTDDELCVRLPFLYAPTVKSARSRLSKRGLLVASGRTRPSARGREQIVWRLA